MPRTSTANRAGTFDTASVERVTATVADSTGAAIDPDSMSHVYGYTAGNLTTDTATDGTSTWVKTFTYTGGVVTAESKWVKA